MKKYSDVVLENQQEEELYERLNWKTMVMGLLLGTGVLNVVNAATSTVDIQNSIDNENKIIEGTVSAKSMDLSMAEKLANSAAKRDALKKLSAGTDVTLARISIESDIISTKKDSDGNFIITIKYKATILNPQTKHIDSQKETQVKKDHYKTANEIRFLMGRFLQKFDRYQFLGKQGTVNFATVQDIIDRFITNNGDSYNIRMLNTEEANSITGGIKFSASNEEGGGSEWVVITIE